MAAKRIAVRGRAACSFLVLALTFPVGARGGDAFDVLGGRVDSPDAPENAVAAAPAAAVMATAAPSPAGGWVVFDAWRGPTIRSDRWIGVAANAHDARREIVGNGLQLRYRLEGNVGPDTGFTSAMQRLVSRTSALTTRIAADFQLRSYEVVGCASNPTAPGTRVRPAMVDVTAFNDGSSTTAGNALGDHFVRVMVNREATSADPWNELRVQAFLFRCVDAACSNALSSVFDLDVGRVFVGIPFTLRAEWDREGHRFVAGVSGYPDVVLPYAPALEVSPPRIPFASVREQNVNAICSTHATVADSTVIVSEVRTNPEAVIP